MGKPPEGVGGGGAAAVTALMRITSCVIALSVIFVGHVGEAQTMIEEHGCPAQDKILPCRCSTRGMEFQIWCSHSELPRVLEGLKAVSHYVTRPVDELILENNNLPSLPGKVFTSLRVLRLMLRNNRLERVSSSWLEGLHDSLLELFIVEPDLRSLPIDSLENLGGLEAITLQSRSMKRLPRFTGLSKLRYIQVNSPSLLELSPFNFRNLPNLEQLHVFGSPRLSRLEAGLLRNLPRLSLLNITDTAVSWIHPRAFIDLPELREIHLRDNEIADASIVGRVIIDLPNLSSLNLNGNRISRLTESNFVDNPSINRLTIAHNFITEISAGAFQRLFNLRVLDLSHNRLRHISPEFFLQRAPPGGSSLATASAPSLAPLLEEIWLIGNEIRHFTELRAILEALPGLKFLDLSHNLLEEIPYGALRGHASLERLHLDHNRLSFLQRNSFVAMPALRELRLRNNSLNNLLETPFWNLPGLKGLDLSENYFRRLEARMLANLPNLRRLDLSGNGIGTIEIESFMTTPALEHINMSGNALSSLHPMTLRHLMSLYELDLGWNRLIEIVPGLPRNIEHLHLAMNRIVVLPSRETRRLALPTLRSLDLSANGIERISPGTLGDLSNLKKLNLAYNSLAVIDDRTFERLNRLEYLDLGYNRIVSLHGRSLQPLTALLDLNLRGNRIDIIRPDLFQDNLQLEKLDFSLNRLAQIPHATFSTTRNLRELYASHNGLTELPASLHGLTALELLDLSFNKLNILSPETLSSLSSLLELRLVKNRIKELREGAFERLPRLTFIDLENNDLRFIEKNAIRSLPELQSLRLGKNRLTNIPSGAFSELPLLQSAELQENRIHQIAANAFINVPHLLFLNLSHNQLPDIAYLGLDALTSLEVLDLSDNRISTISDNSLASMEWLVELKMDDNRICGIEGSPFDGMPRLRVLSLRRNRMTTVREKAFKRLRSNIAILDIDGNPLSCSCGMLWLRGWLQQASTDGPRCADGSFFKDIRLSRQDCQRTRQTEPPLHPGCEAELMAPSKIYESGTNGADTSAAGWMNFRDPSEDRPSSQSLDYLMYNDFNQDDRSLNTSEPQRAHSEESNHVTSSTSVLNSESVSPAMTAVTPDPPPASPPLLRNKTSPSSSSLVVPPSPSSSGFTFFGVPLPSINFNLWGNSGSRKARRKEDAAAATTTTTTTTRIPGRGRYRVFPPTEPEIHRGGFFPLPQGQGGFVPIPDPRLSHEAQASSRINDTTRVPPASPLGGSSNRTAVTATVTRVYQVTERPSKINKLFDATATTSQHEKSQSQLAGKLSFGKEREELTTPRNENNDDRGEKTGLLPKKRLNKMSASPPPSPPARAFLPTVVSSLTLETSSLPTEQQRRIVSSSSELYERETTTVDSLSTEETIWTSAAAADDNSTEKTNKSSIWDIESRLPPGKHITAAIDDESTMMTAPTDNPRGGGGGEILEASALSALLVPGGQISTSISMKPPSGRSTIIKVASPHLSLTADRDFSGNEISTTSAPPTPLVNSIDQNNAARNHSVSPFDETTITVIDNNPFNWYFQNYNETNIEPYVAVLYNGQNNILVSNLVISILSFLLAVQIYL